MSTNSELMCSDLWPWPGEDRRSFPNIFTSPQTIYTRQSGCPRSLLSKKKNYETCHFPWNTKPSSFWSTSIHQVICRIAKRVNRMSIDTCKDHFVVWKTRCAACRKKSIPINFNGILWGKKNGFHRALVNLWEHKARIRWRQTGSDCLIGCVPVKLWGVLGMEAAKIKHSSRAPLRLPSSSTSKVTSQTSFIYVAASSAACLVVRRMQTWRETRLSPADGT